MATYSPADGNWGRRLYQQLGGETWNYKKVLVRAKVYQGDGSGNFADHGIYLDSPAAQLWANWNDSTFLAKVGSSTFVQPWYFPNMEGAEIQIEAYTNDAVNVYPVVVCSVNGVVIAACQIPNTEFDPSEAGVIYRGESSGSSASTHRWDNFYLEGLCSCAKYEIYDECKGQDVTIDAWNVVNESVLWDYQFQWAANQLTARPSAGTDVSDSYLYLHARDVMSVTEGHVSIEARLNYAGPGATGVFIGTPDNNGYYTARVIRDWTNRRLLFDGPGSSGAQLLIDEPDSGPLVELRYRYGWPSGKYLVFFDGELVATFDGSLHGTPDVGVFVLGPMSLAGGITGGGSLHSFRHITLSSTCRGCPSGVAPDLQCIISGITGDCSSANGTYVLEPDGSCSWSAEGEGFTVVAHASSDEFYVSVIGDGGERLAFRNLSIAISDFDDLDGATIMFSSSQGCGAVGSPSCEVAVL